MVRSSKIPRPDYAKLIYMLEMSDFGEVREDVFKMVLYHFCSPVENTSSGNTREIIEYMTTIDRRWRSLCTRYPITTSPKKLADPDMFYASMLAIGVSKTLLVLALPGVKVGSYLIEDAIDWLEDYENVK